MPLKRRPALEPGSYVQAHCTRCRTVLRHTVIALVEGVPARVKCNTCGGEHVYRAPETPSAAGAPRERKERAAREPRASKSSSKRTSPNLEAEWREQLAAAGDRPARRYAPGESFGKGDVVEHLSFGVGVVQRVIEPGKILVLFAAGPKTLVCRPG